MKIGVIFITVLSFIAISKISLAQTDTSFHTAVFSVGAYGSDDYEEFNFDIRNNQQEKIEYSYGKKPKELALSYKDTERINGEQSFKVEFKNGLILNIIPHDKKLKVIDKKGKYSKIFEWHYEGPINGIGTYCQPCADEDESLEILKKYFLKE